MTVTFDIQGARWPQDSSGVCEPPAEMFVNISNVNAYDFLRWLDLPNEDLCGEIPARELAALLRRRLWPERLHRDDPGRPSSIHRAPNSPVVIEGGREPGRLAAYAQRLLALAEHAGDGTIIWY